MTSRKNLHLTVSSILIIIIGLIYGLFPDSTLSKLFDFTVESNNLKQVLRATMGLYTSMAILWITGIFRPKFWLAATISNFFFMIGLASGRIISLVADGFPSIYFSVGLILELILAFWAITNLKKYGRA